MEWFVQALAVPAPILAATSIQMAPQGYAYRGRRFGRGARALEPGTAHDPAAAGSPERKA